MEELRGRQFGPYRVVAALGQGGMASVYKAFQPAVHRHVALKILSRQFDGQAEFLARFRHEAQILAQLQHPHILPIFDFGESGGYMFLAMPFIDGGTLVGLLRGGPLPFDTTGRIIRQLCDALDYAHSKGIVHRDIKPSNILIDERGNCLLADFGIARMVEGTRLTMTGTMMGTPEYMSPEQAAGTAVGPASDIYSAGIVLYELLTGRPPYKADTPIATAVKHLTGPLPPPRQFNPALTPALEAVALKALAQKPEDRFASAGEMAAAVTAAIQAARDQDKTVVRRQTPVPVVPDPLPPTVATEPRRATRVENAATVVATSTPRAPASGKARAAWGAALVVVLVGGVATYLFMNGGSSAPPSNRADGPRDDPPRPAPPAPTPQPAPPQPAPAPLQEPSRATPVAFDPAQLEFVTMLGSPTTDYNSIHVMALGAMNSLLAAGSGDRNVYVWNFPDGSLRHTLRGHTDDVHSVAFSPDGDILASVDDGGVRGDDRGALRLWNAQSGQSLSTIRLPQFAASGALTFAPDGSLLAMGIVNLVREANTIGRSYELQVQLRNAADGQLVRTLSTGLSVGRSGWYPGQVAFSPDGKTLAAATGESVYFWDVSTGRQTGILEGSGQQIAGVAGNGALAVTSRSDRRIRFVDMNTRSVQSGGLRRQSFNQASEVNVGGFRVYLSPDWKWTARGDDAHQVSVCDAETAENCTVLKRPIQQGMGYNIMTSVLFSPDLQYMLAGSDHNTVDVWRLRR